MERREVAEDLDIFGDMTTFTAIKQLVPFYIGCEDSSPSFFEALKQNLVR